VHRVPRRPGSGGRRQSPGAVGRLPLPGVEALPRAPGGRRREGVAVPRRQVARRHDVRVLGCGGMSARP